MMKRILSFFLAAVMVLILMPIQAQAATHDLTIKKGEAYATEGEDYEWNDRYTNMLVIKKDGLTVSGTTEKEHISVESSVTNLTIKDLSIALSNDYGIELFGDSVTLTVVGNNTIEVAGVYNGIAFYESGKIDGNGNLSVFANSFGVCTPKNIMLDCSGTITIDSKNGSGLSCDNLITVTANTGKVLIYGGAVEGAVYVRDGLTIDSSLVMNASANYKVAEKEITGEAEFGSNDRFVKTGGNGAKSLLIAPKYGIIFSDGSTVRSTKNKNQTEFSEYIVKTFFSAGDTFQLYDFSNKEPLTGTDFDDASTSNIEINGEDVYKASADGTYTLYYKIYGAGNTQIYVAYEPHNHKIVKVDGQSATEEAAGWKDYYECKDKEDACHKYFEDATGTVPIENLATWKSSTGKGYIPSGNEIKAAKTAAIAVLVEENGKDPLKVETTLTTGKTNVENANTLADIANAKDTAIAAIKEAQASELATAKTEAKAALDTEEAKYPLTDKTPLTNGKNSIDAETVTTKALVESAKTTAIETIKAAQETELKAAREAAKAALDAEDAKKPLENKTPLNEGKAKIEAAATKAAVETAKEEAIKAIQYAQDAELAAAKETARKALDEQNATDALKDASSVTSGKENINNATTLEKVESAKDVAIAAIKKAQATELKAAQEEAKKALDAENAYAPLKDETPVKDGKDNIDAAKTKASVAAAKLNAIKAIQAAQANRGPDPDPDPDPDPEPNPEPKPVEVYYASLVADLKANEEGVIEWKAGDSLPLEVVKLLVDKPELSLEFTFTYEGAEHTIFIPAGAFEQYYDVNIPWYGPAWLIQYFEKPQKDVIEYIIVKDDTLNALAEKFKCTVEEILALNPYITNPNRIYPNSKLLIPVQK